MKVFGRYLVYRLKNSALRTLILTFLALLMTQTVVSDGIRGFYPEYHDVSLYMHAIVLGVLCTLIPILETAAFKNRRNLDTLYFFPIKRWKMALAHYVSGLVQVFTVYSVTFFTAWIYLEVQTNYFALSYMLPYYLLSLLLGIVVYSFFMFVFGQANTVADGVLFCALWSIALFLVTAAILNFDAFDFMAWRQKNILQEWGIVYTSLNNLTVIFQDLIEINQDSGSFNYYTSYAYYYRQLWYMFLLWAVIGVASAVGYFVSFMQKGAEKAGEISDSWFGYKLLIPLCGYSLMLLLGEVDFIVMLIIFALMVVGYIVYRRSFRFKVSDYIFAGIGFLVAMLGAMM